MKYDRNAIIDKINDLKGKRGTKQYMSNEKIAQYLDVSDKTVKKWLKKKPEYIADDEGGYPDIPFPYVVKLCDLFGCDIEYLIDEKMTCRTKEATDIHKATGLSEDAIMILQTCNEPFISKDSEDISEMINKENAVFLEVINRIIESKHFDMSDEIFDDLSSHWISFFFYNKEKRDKGFFPINQIIDYVVNVRRLKKYESHKNFKDIIRIINSNGVFHSYGESYIDIITDNEEFKKLGFSKKEVKELKESFDGFDISDYLFYTKDKRYNRIDIQDSFSSFLRSNFIEGENNGK